MAEATEAMPTISVAMCTCDGEPFVRAQLESIAAQTLLPHQVIVCDDASVDGTVAAVEAFARSSALPLTVVRNPQRLGPAKNFEQAIARCSGDLIALADQDDVWLPTKLAALTAALDANGPAAYAFCDATPVEADLRVAAGRTLLARRFSLDEIRRGFAQGRELDLLVKRDFVYGTTLIFRSEFRDAVLPIAPGWSQDTWIVDVLACLGHRGAPVLEPLVLYRQHDVQASGGLASPKRVGYPERVAAYEALRSHVAAHAAEAAGGALAPRVLPLLDEKLRYLRALAQIEGMPRVERIVPSLREVLSGRWRRFSPRTFRR